jgi:hypothetical protein
MEDNQDKGTSTNEVQRENQKKKIRWDGISVA